jgi:hypothetical protein
MYQVKAYFRNHIVTEYFIDKYDAIEFKETVDAHYPLKVVYNEGVYPMRTFIVNGWNLVMDDKRNPLSNIPDLQVRHLVMQVLAWMWCIVFAFIVGSWTAFGVSAVMHVVLLAAIAITVGTFETARRQPQYFGGLGRGNGGEHE